MKYSGTTIFLFFQSHAQLNHSVGLKANDNYSGLTYKVFMLEKSAIDLTLHSNLNLDFGILVLWWCISCREIKNGTW